MNLKHAALLAITGAVVGLAPGLAWSGYKSNHPVQVDAKARFASGSLGSARNSADDQQYIGCYLYAFSTMTSPVGVCVANPASGDSGSCYFQDKPDFVALVQSLASDSWMYFQWDESGACTGIQVDKFSQYEPKQP